MTVSEFAAALAAAGPAPLHLMLPDGAFVPPHFHVTEVGRVRKDFIDCGGTTRAVTACVLQTWVADDTAHRLTCDKLAGIFRLAGPLLGGDDLPVEVEYDTGTVSVYPVAAAEPTPGGLLVHLGRKHTACLAPELCRVPAAGGLAVVGCC